jgi:PAS domain S-box-containing protein
VSALHPDDVEHTLAAWSAAVRDQTLYEAEYRFRGRDGTYRWFLARGVPMRNGAGEVVRWFGTCTDVDDAKRAHTLLVDSERQARVLADVLPTILWTAAPSGALTSVNQRWVDYTGLSFEASAGVWPALIHPDDRASLDAYGRAVANGERFVNEFRFRRRDGVYRWFHTVAEPVRDEAGAIVRWVGATHDIQDARDARDVLLRELEREHKASTAFQHAALPATLPLIPGIVFNAVYSAARSEALVGGDWYDVFRLSDGRVVLSIGDVSGSGLDAAVTMGAVRQSIRGAAQIYPDPVAVLDAADRALRSEQPERIVTAFAGVFDPLTSNLMYASAGHPAPLVRRSDGTIVELTASGLPLGLRPGRHDDAPRTITLAEDSLVVFYTDGLIEATRDLIEGERLLREALEQFDVRAADEPARALLDAVVRDPIDDVAILTMHVGAIPTARWSIDVTDRGRVRDVRFALAERLREHGANDADVCTAELLFSELVGNVVRHSGGLAEIAVDATGEYPVLHVLDRGSGFTFHARLPNDVMSESGRGLYIASMLARDLSVVPRPDGGSHARAVLPLAAAARGVPASA